MVSEGTRPYTTLGADLNNEIDGPFGSASEDVFKFEVGSCWRLTKSLADRLSRQISVLVGGGIGTTPFASS